MLADGERRGTVLHVQFDPDRIVGRVDLGYQPVAAVDTRNRQLIAICSPADNSGTALVAYALDDLSVRWQVPLAERILTKVVAMPSVMPSVDGKYVFTYHYRTLRPGDGNAPGNTRYWIGVRDAGSGALLREVETPLCSVAMFHQAGPERLFLSCGSGHVRVIRTDTWQEAGRYAAPATFRLAAVTAAGDRYVTVSQDLWIIAVDTSTGRQLSATHWSESASPVVPFFGQLAMSLDGSAAWIPIGPPSYEARPGDTIAEIDLLAGKRSDHRVADLGGVGVAHDRVFYVGGGWLGSIDGRTRVDLGVSHPVVAWRILAGP